MFDKSPLYQHAQYMSSSRMHELVGPPLHLRNATLMSDTRHSLLHTGERKRDEETAELHSAVLIAASTTAAVSQTIASDLSPAALGKHTAAPSYSSRRSKIAF